MVYREVLREKINPALFFLFNVAFISLAQSILLFMISTPTYVILLTARFGEAMNTSDIIYARVLMGLVLIEFFADQQQWSIYHFPVSNPQYTYYLPADYQNAKKEYQKTAKVPHKFDQEDLDRGFVVTGLWSWSRHPNFAAEQAIWVVLYQWGCWSSDVMYNWTFAGAMSYLILFQASTWFTELITAGKYPEYAEYQKRVGKFIPRLSTDLPGDFSDQKAQPKVEKKTAIKNGGTTKK
jgi:steroid 5-alpha reductase family enzyme